MNKLNTTKKNMRKKNLGEIKPGNNYSSKYSTLNVEIPKLDRKCTAN